MRVKAKNPGHIEEESKGLIIEVEYEEVTPDGSLWNAVFMQIRDDKTEPDTIAVPE
jgi:hypothetical protein